MSLRRAAAVALARAASAAAAAPSASASAAPLAAARRAATTHAKLAGKTESSGKADIFGLFAGLALSAAFVAYDQLYPEEEFEGRIPYYPYLRMRQRSEFPWGKNGLFEPHPRVVPDGEEPEHH